MEPFITYKEGERYFILQKEFPHFVVEVDTKPNYDAIKTMPIRNTYMHLNYVGTLRGNMFPVYGSAIEELGSVFFKMADWYYENRILTNPKKYKKWILNQEQTT